MIGDKSCNLWFGVICHAHQEVLEQGECGGISLECSRRDAAGAFDVRLEVNEARLTVLAGKPFRQAEAPPVAFPYDLGKSTFVLSQAVRKWGAENPLAAKVFGKIYEPVAEELRKISIGFIVVKGQRDPAPVVFCAVEDLSVAVGPDDEVIACSGVGCQHRVRGCCGGLEERADFARVAGHHQYGHKVRGAAVVVGDSR